MDTENRTETSQVCKMPDAILERAKERFWAMVKHECLSTCDRPSCPACNVVEDQAAAGRELAGAVRAYWRGQQKGRHELVILALARKVLKGMDKKTWTRS